jgi:hypothetical protein
MDETRGLVFFCACVVVVVGGGGGAKYAFWKFVDSRDTLKQVWRHKNAFWEFRDPDDTKIQVQQCFPLTWAP